MVVVDGLSKKFEEMAKQLEPVTSVLNTALEPFYDTDEVEYGIMIGGIGRGRTEMGARFTATSTAAKAAIDALPGYRIIDFSGREYGKPAPQAPAPKGP